MTDEEILQRLKSIADNLSEDEYPETMLTIDSAVSTDFEELYDSTLYLADELSQSDETKVMPPLVADLVKEIYTEEIESGNADAACNLGALYYTGRIGEQSYAKAVELYKKAAEGGNRTAAENLGYCYYYGRDMEIDYEKAFHYFALGAFDGHLISLYKIGDMYKNGYYVSKNEKEAFYIYNRCAETMTDEALHICGADIYMRLGDCYYKGIGTDVDLEMALGMFQKAEGLFRERLRDGDFLIKKVYTHCVEVQQEIRKAIEEDLPRFEWTNN